MKNKFYITTPIYYVNDRPHIGHAYTTVAADVLARFQRIQEEKVFLLTGTDEHGLKIQKRAEELGKEPQEFVDEISAEFKNLWDKLDIKYDNFIRTTDKKHKDAVQKVLRALYNKGAIYKGTYEGLYCVGCEQFKNENELVDGRCPDHDIVVEKVKEECYLLKMAGKIQEELIGKIKSDEFKITPARYKKEILSFLERQELKDISISRKNLKWGIPLPFDSEQVTYVWVDAFLSYLTGLGWNGNTNDIPRQWPPDIQLIGKDILRMHATIWPALLLHLGIELPELLFVQGHILSGGKKMSKTLGNVISIDEMIEKFGVDGARYLLISAGTFGEDVDVTMERMVEKYNADLANGLGNLVSRALRLAQISNFPVKDGSAPAPVPVSGEQFQISNKPPMSDVQFSNFVEKIELCKALNYVQDIVKDGNKLIEDSKLWELVKTNKEKFNEVMRKLVSDLNLISKMLVPFMPDTSEKIIKALEEKKAGILFPRIK